MRRRPPLRTSQRAAQPSSARAAPQRLPSCEVLPAGCGSSGTTSQLLCRPILHDMHGSNQNTVFSSATSGLSMRLVLMIDLLIKPESVRLYMQPQDMAKKQHDIR